MPATMTRVRGIKRYFEPKTGKYYCYHRATGKRIVEEFGSPDFFERLSALNKEAAQREEDAAKPGTLKALILDYKQADEFKDLEPRTKRDYEGVFAFLEPLWEASLRAFTPPKLNNLRNKWRKERGRRFVNYVRSVLSILFGHGMSIGIMATNPARDMKTVRRPRDAKVVNRPWSLAERCAAMERLPAHIRLPVAIGLYTGIREGDVLRLPRNIVVDGRIAFITRKRRVAIDLHVLPGLRRALQEAPKHDAIRLCANSRGQPWTESGFRCSFRKALKALEKEGHIEPGLTFHGLRHTVATELAEAGVPAEDIAAVLGQRSSKIAEHYSKEADRSRRSTAAIRKLRPFSKGGKPPGKNG